MSNEMTTTNGTGTDVSTMFAGGINPFQQAVKDAGGGGIFGRMNGKTGAYVFGDETLDHEVGAAFEFEHAKYVWLGFDSDNNPKRGPEAFIIKREVLEEPDRSDKNVRWNKQLVIPIVTDQGQRVIYSAKADTGRRPIMKLMNEYGGLVGRKMDDQGRFKVPYVSMSSAPKSTYVTDAEGRKVKAEYFIEVFRIEDWITKDDVADMEARDGDAEPEMKVVNGSEVEEAQYEIIDPPKNAAPTQAAPAARPTTGTASRFKR